MSNSIKPNAWYITTEDAVFGPFATKADAVYRTPGTDGFPQRATRIAAGVYSLNDCNITKGSMLDPNTVTEEM